MVGVGQVLVILFAIFLLFGHLSSFKGFRELLGSCKTGLGRILSSFTDEAKSSSTSQKSPLLSNPSDSNEPLGEQGEQRSLRGVSKKGEQVVHGLKGFPRTSQMSASESAASCISQDPVKKGPVFMSRGRATLNKKKARSTNPNSSNNLTNFKNPEPSEKHS